MTYRERLDYWAVARCRADAEGHCGFMQRANPTIRFEVVFDLPAPLATKPLPKPTSR